MALNQRKEYGDFVFGQANKSASISQSGHFVRQIMSAVEPHLDICTYFESEAKLGSAPAVELPSGRVVIAPDILCRTNQGSVFWIEAKDKCQRFYKPDTGADIHQVYGWYKVWAE